MKKNRFEECTNVSQLLHQLTGAGSVCWENPGGAGVFDDKFARAVTSDALEKLKTMGNDPIFHQIAKR